MTIAFVGHALASGLNSPITTTPGIDSRCTNPLIVTGNATFGDLSSVTDNQSNGAYTLLTKYSDSGNAQIAYKAAPVVAASHTWTQTQTSIFCAISAAVFSGVLQVSPLDQETGHGLATNDTSIQPGSLTPSMNGCLIISLLELAGTDTAFTPSGYTLIDGIAGDNATREGLFFAYKIQSTAAAENPLWTWTVNSPACTALAIFKPAVSFIFPTSLYSQQVAL